jgi:hypothetical protein
MPLFDMLRATAQMSSAMLSNRRAGSTLAALPAGNVGTGIIVNRALTPIADYFAARMKGDSGFAPIAH